MGKGLLYLHKMRPSSFRFTAWDEKAPACQHSSDKSMLLMLWKVPQRSGGMAASHRKIRISSWKQINRQDRHIYFLV